MNEDFAIAAKGKDNPPRPLPDQASPSWAAQDPDVQLMLRFQAGDEKAFDELVERNTGKIHALVFRFLGDPSHVEDVAQEVFLRVYRTAARYTPTAKFSTWLYRIAANLSFNVLRSRGKSHMVSLDAGGDDDDGYHRDVPDDSHPSPSENLSRQELRQKIADAVNQLPENQQIAIVLNKYENKSYEEIAAVLGCTSMAVKSLLSRARSNLSESLGRYLKPE
ncbi:MAG: sigma-70 family RNA polymerase sigma factor [Planctomycetaceae bacterium]|nr:MAG: sigma-70 family RNA polymerase sigma factor [Planctomycetaceae bacterium]